MIKKVKLYFVYKNPTVGKFFFFYRPETLLTFRKVLASGRFSFDSIFEKWTFKIFDIYEYSLDKIRMNYKDSIRLDL